MAIVLIKNKPIKYKRPNTSKSKLFIAPDGQLYDGYYLKTNMLHIYVYNLESIK